MTFFHNIKNNRNLIFSFQSMNALYCILTCINMCVYRVGSDLTSDPRVHNELLKIKGASYEHFFKNYLLSRYRVCFKKIYKVYYIK